LHFFPFISVDMNLWLRFSLIAKPLITVVAAIFKLKNNSSYVLIPSILCAIKPTNHRNNPRFFDGSC